MSLFPLYYCSAQRIRRRRMLCRTAQRCAASVLSGHKAVFTIEHSVRVDAASVCVHAEFKSKKKQSAVRNGLVNAGIYVVDTSDCVGVVVSARRYASLLRGEPRFRLRRIVHSLSYCFFCVITMRPIRLLCARITKLNITWSASKLK